MKAILIIAAIILGTALEFALAYFLGAFIHFGMTDKKEEKQHDHDA